MLASQSVTLTATASTRSRKNPDSKLAFQSLTHDFVIKSEVSSINFRVGADISLSKGIYYIEWSISETGHSSSNSDENHYHEPAKTKVEVISTSTSYTKNFVTEGFGGQTFKGTTSPDIGISVSNSPFSDVTVTLSLVSGTNENITF